MEKAHRHFDDQLDLLSDKILRMGGLLESVRGRHGGYRLARPAEKIPVAEVLAVLGGRVFEPAYCSRYTGDRKLCVHSVDCAIRRRSMTLGATSNSDSRLPVVMKKLAGLVRYQFSGHTRRCSSSSVRCGGA